LPPAEPACSTLTGAAGPGVAGAVVLVGLVRVAVGLVRVAVGLCVAVGLTVAPPGAVGLGTGAISAPGTRPVPGLGTVAVGLAVPVCVGVVRVAVGVRVVGLVPGVPGTTPPVRVPVPVAPGLTHDAPVVPVVTPVPGAGTTGPVRVGLGDRVPGLAVAVPLPPPFPVSIGGAIGLGSCGTSVGCATGVLRPAARPAIVNIPATTAAGTMSATAMRRLVRPRVRCSGIVIPPRVVSGPQASTPNS